ncbi:MAG: hypothetical protein ILA26_03380 [Methanobrevibacter sp.]|uniref:hypothetical protein n=1 Tax=Methanobrevibacter sp. TaxID=66852 RepID=UPI001B26BF72|nr:hypothetical protein [Methanobrevibacter sp.]MBO6111160.1 hypothetical protein [Methanobrevibacter sp.]MBP3791052.1 hypothetical protein [Methanobrevibacter sp.]
MEENGLSVGEAIDTLFELKDTAFKQMDAIERGISFVDELKDSSMTADKKIEAIEKRYAETGTTAEMRIQEIKHNISWGRDFFKF